MYEYISEEYKTRVDRPSGESLINFINRRAAEGWRLVTILPIVTVPGEFLSIVFFERKLP